MVLLERGLTIPPASRSTEARQSTPDMMRFGIAEIQIAANPIRPTRIAKPPAKALKAVVAGTDPNTCHFAAVMERPSTTTAKRSWSARVARVAIMLATRLVV